MKAAWKVDLTCGGAVLSMRMRCTWRSVTQGRDLGRDLKNRRFRRLGEEKGKLSVVRETLEPLQ